MKQIKIYGLGGQGVVTCGKLMAHAYAINQEEFAQTIPAYGHERRGAPVTTSLILSREAILTKSFVYEPDYVLVFDVSLPERHVDIFDGATGDTAFLFNAPQVPAYMTGRTYKVCAVDAGQAALRHIGRNIPNTAMAGAFAALGLIRFEALERSIREFFKEEEDGGNVKAARECYRAACGA